MYNKDFTATLNDILRFVSISSFTDDLKGIRKCQETVASRAKELGFEVTYHGNCSEDKENCWFNRVLVIQPKRLTGQPDLGIVVHLDTVPFSKNEWTHNPLGEISEGRIYGRGVLDDKGAIAIALNTLKHLEETIKPTWQLIVGSSEEGKWVDMEAYLAEKPILPKFLVTIDGDGVQNGCRGYLDIKMSFCSNTWKRYGKDDCNKAYGIKEISVPNAANNVVPAQAQAILNNGVIIQTTGKACHSSIPELGENALLALVGALGRDYELRDEYNDFFNFMDLLSQPYCADLLGFAPDTSITPTDCVMHSSTIEVMLNIRLGCETTETQLEEALKNLKNFLDFRKNYTIENLTMPAFIPADSMEMQYMCEAYKEVMGKNITPEIAKGVGYNAALPNCAIFGPRFAIADDELDTCHCADENRKIDDLKKFDDMLTIFLVKCLKRG